jgi:hypothetical protein
MSELSHNDPALALALTDLLLRQVSDRVVANTREIAVLKR